MKAELADSREEREFQKCKAAEDCAKEHLDQLKTLHAVISRRDESIAHLKEQLGEAKAEAQQHAELYRNLIEDYKNLVALR